MNTHAPPYTYRTQINTGIAELTSSIDKSVLVQVCDMYVYVYIYTYVCIDQNNIYIHIYIRVCIYITYT